jgi:hypothetical protein
LFFLRFVLLLHVFLTAFLVGCAHPQGANSVFVSDVLVKLPENENWKILDVADQYESTQPTIAFAQLDRADPMRILSIFRVSALALNQVDPTRTSIDPCLAFLSRLDGITFGVSGASNAKPFKTSVTSRCSFSGPGNETTQNWFEKNAGPLKLGATKAGIHFNDEVVGETIASTTLGASRRLIVQGFISMGPPNEKSKLATDAAKKRLSVLTALITAAIKGAETERNFVFQMPSASSNIEPGKVANNP